VTDCYATGSVTGSRYSSRMGAVGDNTGLVMRCYCAGTVSGDRLTVAGVAGGTVADSYYLRHQDIPAPYWATATGLTDSQMRDRASFVGWDFVGGTEDGTEDIWTICEDKDYPRLWWERVKCE